MNRRRRGNRFVAPPDANDDWNEDMMKKQFLKRIVTVLFCLPLLLTGCKTGSENEGQSTNPTHRTTELTETNTAPVEEYKMKNVKIGEKNISEFLVATDLASDASGNYLATAIQTGTGVKAVIHCAISDIGLYPRFPYIRIATLPIYGEAYSLEADQVLYREENGNFDILVGSRQITEVSAVEYFLSSIVPKNMDLTGFSRIVTLEKNLVLENAIEKAETQAQAIRNAENGYSASDVTGNGNCYYVSFSTGNDSNDGRSPESAWKTIGKVSEANFTDGSVVLFKRGDVWRIDDYSRSGRAGYFFLRSNVIYSAYGEGKKPMICGSPYDAAKDGSWTETDIKNVWRYSETYNGMSNDSQNDVGNMIFNGGEAYGYKLIPGKEGFGGTLAEMTRNYQFWYNTQDDHVYLYFDGGNPGTYFSSIELGVRLNLVRISGMQHVVFDNFCLMYGGAHGIAVALSSDVKITNCEIGWTGGGVYDYSAASTARYGNGIELNRDCANVDISGNYIYQIYDTGITHQFDSRNDPNNTTTCYHKNITYADNVIENCFYGIEYFIMLSQNKPETERYMQNISITGNSILYAGYGWGYWRPSNAQPGAALIKGWDSPDSTVVDGTVKVEGNNFVLSKHDMIYATCENEADIPNIENNLFIQYENHKTVTVGTESTPANKRQIWNEEKLAQNQYLSDKNNRFVTVA